MAASGQRSPDAASQPVAADDADSRAIARIVDAWPKLSPQVREAILVLVSVVESKHGDK
jgi:hypothetical protein